MNQLSPILVVEIIGVTVIFVSVIILAISVRQNTKSQKALAVESLTAAITAINVPAIESSHVGFSIAKAMREWNSAKPNEQAAAHYFLFSFFKLLETAWYLKESKVLDDEQWLGWEALLRKYYHADGVACWWKQRGGAYAPKFRDYLEQTDAPDEIGCLTDIFDPWAET